MSGKKKSVLVVEDDKYIGELLCKKLKNRGIEAKMCLDGRQALDLLYKEVFDLVLLDLVMPILDGFAVLEERPKTLNHSTSFIVITALGQDEDIERAKRLGAEEVFQKALITIEEVIKRVEKKMS